MTNESNAADDLSAELRKLTDRVEKLEKKEKSGFCWHTDFEDAQRHMLGYAHSSTQNHVGYIIAIAIGLFTLFSRWDSFFSHPLENVPPLATIIFFVIIAVTAVLTIYMSHRTLYWSTYHSVITALNFDELEKQYEKSMQEHTKDSPKIPFSGLINDETYREKSF